MQWTQVGAKEILLRYKTFFVQRLIKHCEEAQRDDGVTILGGNFRLTWTDNVLKLDLLWARG